MKALVLLVLLAGVAGAAPTGFDHVVHDRNLIVNGGDSLACARCHTDKANKLIRKPGHAACFGACHGPLPAPKTPVGDRTRVCASCHESVTAKKPPANYVVDPDFNVSFGHKQHAGVACAQCHDMRDKAPKPAIHARCTGCHDGGKGHGPPMANCTSCHPQGVGKPQPPELAVVQNTVTSTFSHGKHAVRGPVGRDCATCHAAIRESDDTQLPRPTMNSCGVGGCHDAKAAFATTAACTKCHDRAPTQRFDVWRPSERFTHRGNHAQVVASTACKTCHVLTSSGELRSAGHAPCAECHADDFAARQPKTCGACHNATEPWRKLTTDRGPPSRTEFGAMLDHGKHDKAECSSCHSLRSESSELRPPRGHESCRGCHNGAKGAKPQLDDCKACHQTGLAAARETARMTAPWSVRAMFDHATHAKTVNGNDLACRACHTSVAGTNLLELATPQKATCLPCHDEGKGAFKLTGTTCKRCHGGK